MKTLKELLERKKQINEQLTDEKRSAELSIDDLKGLETELREINNDIEELEMRERLAKESAALEDGTAEARTVETFQTNPEKREAQTFDEKLESNEYRTAWAKDMLGLNLSTEERNILDQVNDEYREFTHNTENSQILIPKTVAAGIWKRAEEQYPLWADTSKFNVKGNLTIMKGSASKDAEWYDEATKVDTDELKFGELNLTGHELAKAVQVTWKLKKMAVQEFEAYIIREIGDRMGIALSKAVYAGSGVKEPKGIKTTLTADATDQLITTDELKYTDLTKMMSTIFSAYANGATIYANNNTVWTTLANLVDGVGRPLFIPDVVGSNGVGRVLGRLVKVDATIPDGEILLGNVSDGYVANIQENITMYREDFVRERLTDYMGYAIVDGGVRDEKAFAILTVGAGTDTP